MQQRIPGENLETKAPRFPSQITLLKPEKGTEMAELENGWINLHELTCYVTLGSTRSFGMNSVPSCGQYFGKKIARPTPTTFG